ncbi:MAG TPA: type II/IV secretion system ATPase subunit [Candidatus Nanoarchaeia archaeon]|nr:type II/IV secretion system ATPase subunit [Candidatus Nanoarchaeia archaeon]
MAKLGGLNGFGKFRLWPHKQSPAPGARQGVAESSVTRRVIPEESEAHAISEHDVTLQKAALGGKIDVKEKYGFTSHDVPILIQIYSRQGDYVQTYEVNIPHITEHTELVLERIRRELITQVSLGMIDLADAKETAVIEDSFREAIEILIEKYFPDVDDSTFKLLKGYLFEKSLGLGDIELLMSDSNVEEIAINSSAEPVWVYHRKHGWLKTNIFMQNEVQIKHYAASIGRKVGRQITILTPLMDANMGSGDRVNATLSPVSLKGNTITFRKFASKPWTITDFLAAKSIDPFAASIIWLAVQYEMSTLIAGGTASGKTSMLNVLANFFPPNQRIISIEDTHELQLPKFLYWVPMITKLPNVEGKGEISMLDLLVNSLRMRPDRILVGEIRRKKEAEVLFEAIHTGHSVYATFHANNVNEAITRITSPPLDVPKSMLPAVSLILVQYRNRRTGLRRTFQIAEVMPDATANVLVQLDIRKDKLVNANKSRSFMDSLELYTGMSRKEISKDGDEKVKVLNWLVKNNINGVDDVGQVVAEYYTNHDRLMASIRSGKKRL